MTFIHVIYHKHATYILQVSNPKSHPAPFSEFASLTAARTETGGKLSSENSLFSTKTFWFLDATKKAFLWKNNLVLMACVCNCNVIQQQ